MSFFTLRRKIESAHAHKRIDEDLRYELLEELEEITGAPEIINETSTPLGFVDRLRARRNRRER